MKIAIITDAWTPQINGVVTTLQQTGNQLQEMGQKVLFVTPELFPTLPCPTYPAIRLALRPSGIMAETLDRFRPNAMHIATEGPLGHAARNYCLKRQLPFTTAFHTRFPEYIRHRVPVPVKLSYAYLRAFHRPATCTMVPSASQRDTLLEKGFRHLVLWNRGVDLDLFRPMADEPIEFSGLPRPRFVYVGRLASEKNVRAFLELDLPGSKVIVGNGPDSATLRRDFPSAHFAGYRTGKDLVRHVSACDVMVFPSKTDTFGLVMLEAMACGLPVAAYPVTGPKDIVTRRTGVLSDDLGKAAIQALHLRSEDCISFARQHSWRDASEQFLSHLAPITRANKTGLTVAA